MTNPVTHQKFNILGFTGCDYPGLGVLDKAHVAEQKTHNDEAYENNEKVGKMFLDTDTGNKWISITNVLGYFPVAQQVAGLFQIYIAIMGDYISPSDRIALAGRGLVSFLGLGLLFLIPDIIATVSRLDYFDKYEAIP